MSEKRRTFYVQTPGYTHQVVLYSRVPGFWSTRDDDKFQYLGHAWLGEKGRRYRIEKWSAPHTGRTFTSLQSALDIERRPANALCVEIMTPVPRCTRKLPPHWKGSGASALRWLGSGGSPLVFGRCSPICPRTCGTKEEP